MARSKVFFLVPLILVGILAAFVPGVVASPRDSLAQEPIWTADLSVAGFGTVTFVPNEDFRRLPNIRFLGAKIDGICKIFYNPLIFGKDLAETENPIGSRFDLSNALVDCGLFLEENAELRQRFQENRVLDAYAVILEKYEASCGISFYRLGWKFDPETDTDLVCVPDWRAVIEAHLE